MTHAVVLVGLQPDAVNITPTMTLVRSGEGEPTAEDLEAAAEQLTAEVVVAIPAHVVKDRS